MIRTLSAVAVSALWLAACGQPEATEPAAAPETPAPTAPATPAPDANALTAAGYGPLRIGMTKAEVIAAVGDKFNPSLVGGAEPEVCDQWRPARSPEGVTVMLENGVLTRISVASPSTLKTDRGFGVGDTAAAIKAAYGPLAVSTPHKYAPAPAEDIFVWTTGGPATAGEYVQDPNARGIRYEIDGAGKVSIVHVGGPSIQLVEGCS
ncbi:hypothetical protein [Brevundimonas sp. NIBR11]|uniref:hypothetical protein n=1 Tax=Brevundimonas sp. NIBR11 TaxID=3015999 RepID=UPI0022F05273|nr:hypothetical protein [Brevundimonas sp. NIBR11]WGM31137.1 hypothetical protein KKHFBJBL_01377 [Brevundimonas sp. NIBR11]